MTGERERESISVHLLEFSSILMFFSFKKNMEKKAYRHLDSLITFYASNSPALRCEASGWRGMAPFA